MTRKAHIAGLISGAMGAAGALGSGQKAEHQLLQRQLARDLEQAGPSLDEPAFSNRQDLHLVHLGSLEPALLFLLAVLAPDNSNRLDSECTVLNPSSLHNH